MFGLFISTFISLISGGGTGWTTSAERAELAQAIKDAGKTGYAESDSGSWERHLEAMAQPQPDDWNTPNTA
jgi:hypothetical protein